MHQHFGSCCTQLLSYIVAFKVCIKTAMAATLLWLISTDEQILHQAAACMMVGTCSVGSAVDTGPVAFSCTARTRVGWVFIVPAGGNRLNRLVDEPDSFWVRGFVWTARLCLVAPCLPADQASRYVQSSRPLHCRRKHHEQSNLQIAPKRSASAWPR